VLLLLLLLVLLVLVLLVLVLVVQADMAIRQGSGEVRRISVR
jgi:hypothetical protein